MLSLLQQPEEAYIVIQYHLIQQVQQTYFNKVPNAGLMLGHRLRRWSNNKPALCSCQHHNVKLN